MIGIVTTNEEKEVYAYEKEKFKWLNRTECGERLPSKKEVFKKIYKFLLDEIKGWKEKWR